jgi:lambda repressor-like predicted transcriptional regulator
MQPITVLQPASIRKALLEERGIPAAEIAAQVPCNVEIVYRVIRGDFKYDTPNTKRIQQLIAERIGMPVKELWPNEDVSGNPRAIPDGGAE